MKLNEIFVSIDGEGSRTGLPVLFVRFFGCNLDCSYCDSQYACVGKDYQEVSVSEVIKKIVEYHRLNRITITGGEPLVQGLELQELVKQLSRLNYEINIETNGSLPIDYYLQFPNVIITADWKSDSSGQSYKMRTDIPLSLRENDVLKFVVSNIDDLLEAKAISRLTQAQVYISPVWGKIEAKEIVDFMLKHKMYNCKVQVQLHKIIWEPNMRGV